MTLKGISDIGTLFKVQ